MFRLCYSNFTFTTYLDVTLEKRAVFNIHSSEVRNRTPSTHNKFLSDLDLARAAQAPDVPVTDHFRYTTVYHGHKMLERMTGSNPLRLLFPSVHIKPGRDFRPPRFLALLAPVWTASSRPRERRQRVRAQRYYISYATLCELSMCSRLWKDQ